MDRPFIEKDFTLVNRNGPFIYGIRGMNFKNVVILPDLCVSTNLQ